MYVKLHAYAPRELEPMIDPNIQKCLKTGNSVSPKYCDLPIALRKPIRSCTFHLISKFISYNTVY